MKIVSAKELGKDKIRKLLVKPPFDEVQLNPKIREANRKIFGADLTAAEVAVMAMKPSSSTRSSLTARIFPPKIFKYRKRSLPKRKKMQTRQSSHRWKEPRTMCAATTKNKNQIHG